MRYIREVAAPKQSAMTANLKWQTQVLRNGIIGDWESGNSHMTISRTYRDLAEELRVFRDGRTLSKLD
jgi:hypothetical protein